MPDESVVLAICTGLFALRVFGQALVVTHAPRWLPSNEHWYSGLMPYRYLLPGQLLLLAIMVWITADILRDQGPFASDWWGASAQPLRIVAWVYFGSMVVRYVLTMTLRPEYRWFRRTIPIWFHVVLAVALWAFAEHHLR